MKKISITFCAVLLLLLVGCVSEDAALAFSAEELILKTNENSSLPLLFEGIKENQILYESSDPEIAIIEDGVLKGLKIGKTVITATYERNNEISAELLVIVENVEIVHPIISSSSDYLKPSGMTEIVFLNQESVGAIRDSFHWEIDHPEILSLDSEWVVTGLTTGLATITATLKTDPSVRSSYQITVAETSLIKDENGEIGAGRLILSATNLNATIQAGEFLEIEIDGALDKDYYVWKSYGNQVAMATSAGRVVGVKAGTAVIAAFSPLDDAIYGVITVTVVGVPNVDYASRLVETALSQEGYVEGPNNDTKYGDWYGLSNAEWCAMFVSWCANQSGITTTIIPKYASCSLGREW
ncbi:MAG TPA: hypothetical protein DD618_00340, partial [Acholeplasmatales bacterium]|nr:hypothetical protein [Acholeplasmatales bacterium]